MDNKATEELPVNRLPPAPAPAPAPDKCGLKHDAPEDDFSKLVLQDQITELPLQDWISKLPDELLASILYSLTMKEAVTTSAISRRWEHLWKSYPRLNFDDPKALCYYEVDNHERARFVKRVNQILSVYRSSQIEEFRISFLLAKANGLDIDNWLQFALERGVKRLELDLKREDRDIESYTFPFKLLSAQNINSTSLQPQPGGIPSSKFLDFKPLKTLSLKFIRLTDKTLKLILLKCTSLEHLVLASLQGLANIDVFGRSLMLRTLEIRYCNHLKSIKICSANLVSFKYLAYSLRLISKVLLQDLPLLTDVSYGNFFLVAEALFKLPCCLSILETLTLYFDYVDKTFVENLKCINSLEFPKLPRVKELSLIINVSGNYSLLAFTSLLNAFPCLEKCVIQLIWIIPDVTRMHEHEEVKEIPLCPHDCLKVVEFGGYCGRPCDLELAMYFIRNAVALEEIVIDTHEHREDVLPYTLDSKRKWNTDHGAKVRSFAKPQFEKATSPRIKLQFL